MSKRLVTSSDSEYQHYRKMAEMNGWKAPVNDALPAHSWLHYWKQMEKYEGGEIVGRPVVPHRSA